MRLICAAIIALMMGCSTTKTTNIEKVRDLSLIAAERSKVKDFADATLIIDSAIRIAQNGSDIMELASLYYQSAIIAQNADMADRSSEHLLKAIDLYETQKGTQQQQNLCRWAMMQPFVKLCDTTSMSAIIAKMDSSDIGAQYHYYLAKAQYCGVKIDLQKAAIADLELRNLALTYFKKALNLYQQLGSKIIFYTHPAEQAYNIALNYFYQFSLPSRADSVAKYMALTNQLRSEDDTKTKLLVDDLSAWMHYFDNDNDGAKAIAENIVRIIDSIGDVNLTSNAYQAYAFLVMLHQEEGDYKSALKYEKELVFAHEKRFNATSQEQLRNIQARYRLQKKEADITALRLKNRNSLIFLTLSLIAVALIITLFIYRRKIYREKIYQAMLEAEMRRDELENIKTNAKPSSQFFDKFFQFIETSYIDKTTKERYIEKLKNIDIENVEKQFTASKKPLTPMDRRYILCFMVDMAASDIANIFSIEISSVHMVRYRIKKKFAKNDTWNI